MKVYELDEAGRDVCCNILKVIDTPFCNSTSMYMCMYRQPVYMLSFVYSVYYLE